MRIQAIELVGPGDAEQREQLRAHRVDGLGLGEGRRRTGRGARAELEDRRERRVAQTRVDHPRLLEQHQVAIRQLAQGRAVGGQQARRAPLGEDQREHLPVGARAAREPVRFGRSREQGVDLGEVGAVPGPQRVAQSVQLAEARARGERHAVQVVEDDAPPRRRGVRPVEIGAQRGRTDLAQLVAGAGGVAARGVQVLLELRRERAAARQALTLRPRPELRKGRGRQAVPFDHGVASGRAGGEELAVLDEEQRLDHERRDAREALGRRVRESARALASDPYGPRSRGLRAPFRGRSPGIPSPSARAGAPTSAPGTSPRSRPFRAAR